MLKEIRDELEHLKNIQRQIKEMVKEAPEGKLRCAVNKGCYQYYCGKTYLGEKKKAEIKKMAQKEYCLKLNRKYNVKCVNNIERYCKERRLPKCTNPSTKLKPV